MTLFKIYLFCEFILPFNSTWLLIVGVIPRCLIIGDAAVERGKWKEGRKGGREEGRKGGREEGRKGGREEGRKGGREG